MYYRVAALMTNETCLKWISTPLTSMEALFRLIRRFSAIPQDHLRVFMAPSREELNTLLEQENSGQVISSVTAEQFLCERRIGCLETEEENVADRTQEPGKTRTGTLQPLARLARSYSPEPVLKQQSGSVLESRRMEVEMGAGGDHDLLYVFTLPISVPQMLAWTRLQVRVLQGELQP